MTLQTEISDLLGGVVGGAFEPRSVAADPEPLVQRSNRFGELIKTRDALNARFGRHRKIGPILLWAALAYLLGVATATVYFEKIVSSRYLEYGGLVLCGVGGVAAAILFACYAYYEAKLAGAEILSQGARNPSPL